MAKQTISPDYRTRDLMAAKLRDLQPVLEAQGVRHTFLFGSVARGDDVPESDVDVIVELDFERHIGVLEFVELASFLENALGRHVDLGTRKSLLPGRHDRILADLHEVF